MWFVAPPGVIGQIPDVMCVVGNRFNVVEGIGVEVLPTLTVITAPLHHVPQVWNHTGRNKRLTPVIEIDAPWMTGAMRKDFELMFCRVITPDTRVQSLTFFIL